MSTDFLVKDSGEPDAVAPGAQQHALEDLPKTCRWRSWSICSVAATARPIAYRIRHGHSLVSFRRVGRWCRRSATSLGPRSHPVRLPVREPDQNSMGRPYRRGVCRDFAPLAITLCRCMNVPARYCTGYLGDIGVPPDDSPMDFSGWFEAYIGVRWYTSQQAAHRSHLDCARARRRRRRDRDHVRPVHARGIQGDH